MNDSPDSLPQQMTDNHWPAQATNPTRGEGQQPAEPPGPKGDRSVLDHPPEPPPTEPADSN